MRYDALEMYERNKNIYLQDAKHPTLFQKVLRKAINTLNRWLRNREVIPVFADRIIEYSVLFQNLQIEKGKHILDFGCVEDLLPAHLCMLGYTVTGMDFRDYPFKLDNFHFMRQDILSWKPEPNKFDAVISISVIEHVGLASYGDPLKNDGDKIAIGKLLDALKPNGRLYITVPAGKSETKRGMRIYDSKKIYELVPNIEMIKFFYKPARYSCWQETTPENIDSLVYNDYEAVSPTQGVAFVVSRK